MNIFNMPKRKSFLVRNGFAEEALELQIDDMDNVLRNALWNVISEFFFYNSSHFLEDSGCYDCCKLLWTDYYQHPLDTIYNRYEDFYKDTRDRFFKMNYAERYDILEYFAYVLPERLQEALVTYVNNALEKHLAGWRFVGDNITKISSKEEVNEVEDVLRKSKENKLEGVSIHINKSIKYLSDRAKPDYENSIKESVSAVESICKLITGEEKATLGAALKIIDDKIKIHPSLKGGFDKIYGYTSDEGGIRHALIEEGDSSFEDAKYMLISCSAFINYLIEKSRKSKIDLKID